MKQVKKAKKARPLTRITFTFEQLKAILDVRYREGYKDGLAEAKRLHLFEKISYTSRTPDQPLSLPQWWGTWSIPREHLTFTE